MFLLFFSLYVVREITLFLSRPAHTTRVWIWRCVGCVLSPRRELAAARPSWHLQSEPSWDQDLDQDHVESSPDAERHTNG